jgi:hypothetical protein
MVKRSGKFYAEGAEHASRLMRRGKRQDLTLTPILSGGDKWLEAQLDDTLPQGWIDLTTRF